MIGKGCAQLEFLKLLDCNQITDAGLISIGEGCPNLHPNKLEHSAKGDGYLATVAATWGLKLESLNLCRCNQITDVGLASIGESCLNLKSLDLRGCDQITDAGLATVGAGCPNLKSLDLGGCNRITYAGLASIGEGCGTSR